MRPYGQREARWRGIKASAVWARTSWNSESSPVTQCSRSSPILNPFELKCLAEPCLKSWTTESWEITSRFCFELLNFQLICYMASDNWNNTVFQFLRAPFSDSFKHTEYDWERMSKGICSPHTASGWDVDVLTQDLSSLCLCTVLTCLFIS